MARQSFLQALHCPYCGSELTLDGDAAADEEIEFGTLRCQCYRYGIVLGIVVLRQASQPSDNVDPVVAALDRGDRAGAVDLLLGPETAVAHGRRVALARAVSWLGRGPGTEDWVAALATGDLRSSLRRWRPNYYGEYLEYRYANPSLLAAIPVIAAMARALAETDRREGPAWVLDLGCGIGHTTYLLHSLAPTMQVVAGDRDFLNLTLARHYVVPEANFVCFDAEAGLPFRDEVFDAAFSLDCVHYIRGKHKLAAELDRTCRPDALCALSHLHNAERVNPNQGIPLSAAGYRRVFAPLGGRLYAEATLLDGFARDGSLALDRADEAASAGAADAFVYLSLGTGAEAAVSTRLDRYMAANLSCLSLNGLYDSLTTDGAAELRLRWPSEELRKECCAGGRPLEERVRFASGFVDAVQQQRFRDLPEETFEALIRSFVIVPQPAASIRSAR